MHNYSRYEQSHNELSARRAVSVSVALNANEEESLSMVEGAPPCANVYNGCIAKAHSSRLLFSFVHPNWANVHLQAMMSLEDKNTCTVLSFLWAGQILWAGKAEKGKVTFLLVTSQGEDCQTERLSFHFLKDGEEYPGLGLHLSKFLATGGPKAG